MLISLNMGSVTVSDWTGMPSSDLNTINTGFIFDGTGPRAAEQDQLAQSCHAEAE